MVKKIDIPSDNNILPLPIEEAMPDNYLPYAVEVAKDRALPDVRDGLKPVHRRILYGAYMLKAMPDKPYYKSARIVGDILGKYHPHGDSSVYDAMVILAQNFSTRMPLIDGHGNWGSVDGDSAAAMRYTEARLAPISLEMLKDIEKDVVNMVDNYSDTEKEPEVLPARYPNLLVNGTFGIAVGLSTNIPPHNLGEVIDGVIALADNKDISTQELMQHIKGPDLPTGGIVIGQNSLRSAYESGEGKVTLRAKTSIEKLDNGRFGIIISEFPYRKNKAKLLETISNMTVDKKHAKVLESITDIRDESDRNGIRAVIEFKKSTDIDTVNMVLKYLFKKTDLQCNINFNMVALVKGKPETLSLKSILENYLEHQKEVVTRRTKKELQTAEKRFHIVEGFIKAIDIMDEVIKTIRASKSKKDAQNNLVDQFGFTAIQAEAILELMLYRLTGLEMKIFQKEYHELEKTIKRLKKILESEKELIKVIKKEILEIKDKYEDKRRTLIINDDSEAQIAVDEIIIDEDIVITLSNEGFIKQISLKSYNRSNANVEDIDYREGDFNKYLIHSNTRDKLALFTDSGNMYQIKGVDIPEGKWKEKGERIDSLINGLDLSKEKIIGVYAISNFVAQKYLLFITNKCGIKKTELSQYDTIYSKIQALRLRKDEKLITALLMDNSREEQFVYFKTKNGLEFNIEEPKIEYNDRGTYTQEIAKVGDMDTAIFANITEEYEYKTFNISINNKALIKLSYSRNKQLSAQVSSNDIICIFTEDGRVYNIPAYLIQNIDKQGLKLEELFSDYNGSKPTKLISVNNMTIGEIFTITRKGVIRKTAINEFTSKSLLYIQSKLKDNDSIVSVILNETESDGDVLIVTENGMCIRFNSENVNPLKKTAIGVTAISLKEEDNVVFSDFIIDEEKQDKLYITTVNNKSFEIDLTEIKLQNRAGKGKKVITLDKEDRIKEIK